MHIKNITRHLARSSLFSMMECLNEFLHMTQETAAQDPEDFAIDVAETEIFATVIASVRRHLDTVHGAEPRCAVTVYIDQHTVVNTWDFKLQFQPQPQSGQLQRLYSPLPPESKTQHGTTGATARDHCCYHNVYSPLAMVSGFLRHRNNHRAICPTDSQGLSIPAP